MAEEEQKAGWEYKPGESTEQPQVVGASPGPDSNKLAPSGVSDFSWQAIEYSEHHRPITWYLGLFLATAVIAGVVYFLTKDYFSTGTVIVLGVVVFAASTRKPRAIECSVSSAGLTISGKSYPFGQFKSFSIIRETESPSIEFFSVKKFMPPVAAHFDAKDEKQITDIVGNYLPYEDRKMAGIDKLAHRLRI